MAHEDTAREIVNRLRRDADFPDLLPVSREVLKDAITAALQAAAAEATARAAKMQVKPSDPTDYKAEFEKLRTEYDKLCDFCNNAVTDAEKIIRPYLGGGAVFGVVPGHKFNQNLPDIPFRLVGDISKALAAAAAEARDRALCQANVAEKGEAVSPEEALQSGAGGDAYRRIEREIMVKIDALFNEALAEYQGYLIDIPRKANAEQSKRAAWLEGRLAGLRQAQREFWLRQPLDIRGSSLRGSIEEERSDDERSAASEVVGLTPKIAAIRSKDHG